MLNNEKKNLFSIKNVNFLFIKKQIKDPIKNSYNLKGNKKKLIPLPSKRIAIVKDSISKTRKMGTINLSNLFFNNFQAKNIENEKIK